VHKPKHDEQRERRCGEIRERHACEHQRAGEKEATPAKQIGQCACWEFDEDAGQRRRAHHQTDERGACT
jgi:hypothetical protein